MFKFLFRRQRRQSKEATKTVEQDENLGEKTLLAGSAKEPGEELVSKTLALDDTASRAKRIIEEALYVTLGSGDGQPWASPVAFWPTSKGLCFATPATSRKAMNLKSNPYCSLSIFDSKAQFMTGCGVQCFGEAAVVASELWPQALRGISPRFPNVQGDVVDQHIGLFTAMGYDLIEVSVTRAFISLFDPKMGGDHRAAVQIDWSDLHASPFSLASSLGPPPDAAEAPAQSIIEAALYMTLATEGNDKQTWVAPVAFWATTLGVCFATPKKSLKMENLCVHPRCSFSIFDSSAPFMTGAGVQCMGSAAVATPDRWPSLLEGIRARFPNFEGDVVEQHVGLFRMMDYALVEVTVEEAFMNRFDPAQGGDYRVKASVDWDGLKTSSQIAPFSLAKTLGNA